MRKTIFNCCSIQNCKTANSFLRQWLMLSALVLFVSTVQAQFPVQTNTQLVPPYSLQLSDYATGTTPRIMVTLTNADLQQPVLNVRLRLTIKGQAVTIQSRDNVPYPIISLVAGVPQRLSLNDLAPYFDLNNLDFSGLSKSAYQQRGRLPEGFYEFCFNAVDVNTGTALSRAECAVVAISLSDPPFLNAPANQSKVEMLDPTNIFFSWTPRHLSSPNAAFTTEYVFQLVELLDNGVAPDVAFRSAQPLYQTTVRATVLQYGPAQPQLLEGKRYGWRVQPRNFEVQNSDEFKNVGFSEVFWFTYHLSCNPPVNIRASTSIQNELTLTWNPVVKASSYTVEYRSRDNLASGWKTVNTISPFVRITDIEPGQTYDYRVGISCKEGGDVFFSPLMNVLMPAPPPNPNAARGRITWAYKASEETAAQGSEPLVSTTALRDETTVVNAPNNPGTVLYPLQHASIKIYGRPQNNPLAQPRLLAAASTDSNGRYNFEINHALIQSTRNHYVVIEHPSGLFSTITRTVTLVRNSEGYRLGDDVLTAQSFQLKPSVFIPNENNSSNVSVDVLMKKDLYQRYSFLKQTGLKGTIITYNNDRYVSLVTLRDGNVFKKLFYNAASYENYVVRVNVPGKPSTFYPLTAITNAGNNNNQKPVVLAKRNFRYRITATIQGTVSFQNAPRRDVRLQFTVNRNDILSNDTTTKFYAVTDALGAYSNNDLPQLKSGAVISIQLTDRTLRAIPFTDESTVGDSSVIQKDIVLQNDVYTISGRLVDQEGMAIGNALVTIPGLSQQTKTSAQGFYMLKTFGSAEARIQFLVNGYSSQSINVKPTKGNTVVTAQQWQQRIESGAVMSAFLRSQNSTEVSAELLGIGTGRITTLYTTYFSAIEELSGHTEAPNAVVTIHKGTLSVGVQLNSNRVAAQIKFGNGSIQQITASELSYTSLAPGRHTYTITSVDNTKPFFPISGEVQITANDTVSIMAMAAAAFRLSGVVRDAETNKGVDSATISLTGYPYTSQSDSTGAYSILIPANTELRVKALAKGYNAKDSSLTATNNRVIDFMLQKRSPGEAIITKVGGFPAEIESQSSLGNNRYSISGTLVVDTNAVFAPNPAANGNKLSFRNVVVVVADQTENGRPEADLEFEEAVMQTGAFGFALVEVTGAPQIKMRSLKNSSGQYTYERTVIGGAELKLKLSGVQQVAILLPISLPDAELTSLDPDFILEDSIRRATRQSAFRYVYTAPGVNIAGLSAQQEFSVKFDERTDSISIRRDTTHIKVPFGLLASLFIEKSTAVLSESGLAINGFLELPKLIGARFADSGKVEIDKFLLDRNFAIKEVTFLVSKNKPLIANVQKIQAQLTSLSLYGLGTVNMGIGFGGSVTLKKAAGTGDTLFINSLSIVNTPQGVTLAGDFKFDANGISIKSLVFKTPGNNSIAVAFNFVKRTFELEASGVLTYDKARGGAQTTTNDGGTSALTSVFPIEIQKFKFSTSDWSWFLAAKANIKLDFKVVKVNVDKFLVSVGSSVTLDEMNGYLTENKPQTLSNGGPDELVDEARASWAIGIAGGVEFPIKELRTNIQGSFLIGNVNNKIEVRLNEIALDMTHPAFTLSSKIKIVFSGTRQGFEAAAQLTTMNKGFEAYFKFYKISASPGVAAGFELGASIKVSAAITTGPLLWHSVGGGFDFNTSSGTYFVFLTGDVGTVGTPKEVSYVKDARLSILFETKVCGAVPVIEGGGTLMLQNRDWASVGVKLDFCRTLLLVTVKTNQMVAPGINLELDGVLVAMRRTVNNRPEGAFFLGVNGKITTMGDMLNGNVYLALGINYNNNDINAPIEVKNQWSKIAAGAKDNNGAIFNGLYISGVVNVPARSGGFTVNIAGFDAFGFNYSFTASGAAEVFYKFSSNTLSIKAAVSAKADANLTVFGLTVYGTGTATIALAGGYANDKWFMSGSAAIGLQLFNNSSSRCNTSRLGWRDCCCSNLKWLCDKWCRTKKGKRYWCGTETCTKRVCIKEPVYSFKVCKSLSASFNYRQGEATRTSFSLN
jgi:hypothetical protein